MNKKVSIRNKRPKTKDKNLSLKVSSPLTRPLTSFFKDLRDELKHYSIFLKIILLCSLGIALDLLSRSLEHSKIESSVPFSTVVSTINVVGIGFIISSIIMIGFTIITPFIVDKFSNIFYLKNSASTSDENEEDSKIFHEYFLEISKLNEKMEKEQKEIEQIKSETFQIAYETQEALSILRSKVGMN